MFDGLRSRCSTFLSCASAIAWHTSTKLRSSCARENRCGAFGDRIDASVSPRWLPSPSAFITKNGRPDESTARSCTGTIDGCCSRPWMRASRRNRVIDSGDGLAVRIRLITTSRASGMSCAASTSPMPPDAIAPVTR